MKSIYFIVGMFAALSVLLDLVVLTGFRSGYETPLTLFIGLALGQLALLALWCVLGRNMWKNGAWGLRLPSTLAAAACLSVPLGRVTGGSWAEWFTLLCLFTACTSAAVLLAEWTGLRLRNEFTAPVPAAAATRRPFLQFSLGGLLALMTTVAATLGVCRHLVFPGQWALAAVSYGFWLVLIAITTLWAITSRHAFFARLLLLTTLCLIGGWFMARAEHQQNAWFFTQVAMIETVVISAGIAALQSDLRAHATAVDQPR